jgi:hypothetical protein
MGLSRRNPLLSWTSQFLGSECLIITVLPLDSMSSHSHVTYHLQTFLSSEEGTLSIAPVKQMLKVYQDFFPWVYWNFMVIFSPL